MNRDVKQIEWLVDKNLPRKLELKKKPWAQTYGDLTALNRERVLLDSVGGDVLTDIVLDFLNLLETSAAVYEKNGDYALGIFSSGWCRTLDRASRDLCDSEDLAGALACGKWYCHESCWTDAAKVAIESGERIDIECHGGINIFAVPIRADHEIIGVINFGYGDPPRDPQKVRAIARKYGVDADELMQHAEAYDSRPRFLIDVARDYLITSAQLIGEIAARKRTADTLLQKNNFLESIFDTARTIILVLDTEGRIVRFNPYMERLSGYKLEEVEGKDWFTAFLPSDEQERIKGVFESCVSGIRAKGNINPIIKKNGHTALIEWWDAELKDPKGALAGILAIGQDITERVQAEEKEKKLVAQVQHVQKLESLGTLAGGIAHDFNNLLMGIIGNLDLAKENIPSSTGAFDNLSQAEMAAKRASELCRQLLAYSGKGRFIVESVNINDIVDEMVHLLEVSISKKVVLKYNLTENLPPIRVDATQTRQVIMNLITNASESIGEKSGVVSVITGVMECDRTYLDEIFDIEDLSEGVYVYLEVTDTGCGMSAETIEKIFDPFFTTKFTGRGLGLAAVLGIVRGHGGAIKIYSEPGRGTTFKVLFPASDQPAMPLHEEAADAGSWRGEGLILVVDDDETVRAVCKLMLERLGFEVMTASDGCEAVDLFRGHVESIRCVLLDLTMPRMDGDTALGEMRRIKSDVPVLLTSGYNEQEVIDRFAGRKMAGFIQKPFQKAALSSKLREILEKE